jgi:DNA-binding ferritin-like protein (Dps family)
MGIRGSFEEIFEEYFDSTFFYDQKTERDILKQFKVMNLNIKGLNKNMVRPYEGHEEVIRNTSRERMVDFQKTLDELKRMIEEDKIDLNAFKKLRITSPEEHEASNEIYKLLIEKIKSLPNEKKAPYEEAKRTLFRAGMRYTLKRVEANLQRYLEVS